ncbi:GGDEF domain-containing protein [Enterovirga rhinocerotis]|uniref:Diguanylate cyclase DosC n=1 Tax=Enterovirga rhinocerotis TaxID=1339210 RepID=A0A4R7BKN9_9HYPH|nr:GGDEF domain-containing protein [Enterovirga rhinocerotis]TDR85142.1 diguanylate cyclase [Enterovirga rhinocerotis]
MGVNRSFSRFEPVETRHHCRDLIVKIVDDNVDQFVGLFYNTFLSHQEASGFLTHSAVQKRLSHSLRRWLLDLVRTDPSGDLDAFDARQVQIGQIHARIKLPSHLVLEGATLLKSAIGRKVGELGLSGAITAETLILLDELVDYAMRLVTEAYVSDTKRGAEADEALRLFSLGQDINLERETQRAALMEWSHEVLFGLLSKAPSDNPPSLSGSAFGLWVRHRAPILFQNASSLSDLAEVLRQVDEVVLPGLPGRSNQLDAVAELQRRVEEIKYLIGTLFQDAAAVEAARDPLTRALNRRFLPSVLSREMAIAKAEGLPLSVAMLDVDHFKRINDEYGHQIGDVVLGHVADLVMNNVRSSDFVFRYGGEEFLLVLGERSAAQAAAICDRLRRQFLDHTIPLNIGRTLSVTVSIGVAAYAGHPDFEYLIKAADDALYRAKKEGRDRVVLAA